MAESTDILHSASSANSCTHAFRSQRTKYGAFSAVTDTKAEDTWKHVVSSGDTLMGLAVRYNVPVENIKRLNNLWTDADICLRPHLLIPIHSQDTLPLDGCKGIRSASPNERFRRLEGDETITISDIGPAFRRSVSVDKKLTTTVSSSSSGTLPRSVSSKLQPSSSVVEDSEKISATEYLSRFDTQLFKIKSNLDQLESKSSFGRDENNPLSLLPAATFGAVRYLSRNEMSSRPVISRFSNEEESDYAPELQFNSVSIARKQNCAPRAHKEQEFYDL